MNLLPPVGKGLASDAFTVPETGAPVIVTKEAVSVKEKLKRQQRIMRKYLRSRLLRLIIVQSRSSRGWNGKRSIHFSVWAYSHG